ncbi:MAG TPA: hypothetical protein VNZ50_06805 [Hyphomicrobiaceae bacterium]|nr:hypothetical protein [Hyphomicrobiaceae bacterium]
MGIRVLGLILTAVVIAAPGIGPALSAESTAWGKGGSTQRFAADRAKLNAKGEQMRITGHCQSACTMFLAARKVCVEPSATLLFHAGNDATATKRMLDSYKPALRQYLVANKIMETKAFTSIPGSVIISRFGYPRC